MTTGKQKPNSDKKRIVIYAGGIASGRDYARKLALETLSITHCLECKNIKSECDCKFESDDYQL